MSRFSNRRALLLTCGIAACAGACSDDLKDPLIEALLPGRGAPGALVDVVGERFTMTRGLVHFGGRPAKVLIWSPQRARVQVPDVGLFGLTLVVLTAEGRPSNAVPFYVEGDPRPDTGVPDMGPIPDLPLMDLPLMDLPLMDLPLMDLPLMDGPLMDAAPDAGAEAGGDLGTPDLTPDLPMGDILTDVMPTDAAPDAAAPDAATPDAATPDAATPDAATPDAATPDAPAPDGPTPDAAAPDAGGDL